MSAKIDKTVKAIVWDFDGTLVDSFEVFATVLIGVALANNYKPPTRQKLRSFFHGTMEEDIRGVFNLSDQETVNKLHKHFLKDQEAYYEHPNQYLFGDSLDLAQRANKAGLRQLIVTNRLHHNHGNASPRHIVEYSDLKPVIEHIICRDEGLYRKPDARILNDFLDNNGLQASDLLVIGDQHVDAELAINLGTRAILVNRHVDPIPHLDNLPNWQAAVTVVGSLADVIV